MGKLIYSLTTSLDGYASDSAGKIDWAEPSEEVHKFVNNLSQNVGTFLLGRKMYETLAVWDTIRDTDSEAMNEFAEIWRAAKKIVYSTTLSEATTLDTKIETDFNPDYVKKLLAVSDKDIGIGGPQLASAAINAGIVDEYHQFIAPIILGEGNHWLQNNSSLNLELVDARKFDNGFVHLQYKPLHNIQSNN